MITVNGEHEEKQYDKRTTACMKALYEETKEKMSKSNGKVLAEHFCKDNSIQAVKVHNLLHAYAYRSQHFMEV